jgi:NAD(P)-dependent dehydrogenase (short-subunit alcohol dehydrogenase family)
MCRRQEGKRTVISGSGGISSATASIFCQQGAEVALVDQQRDSLEATIHTIKTQQPTACIKGYAANLGQESESERVINEIVTDLGGIDVLSNNVGIRRYEALADAPWESWDEIVRVNLLSYVAMSRAALPYLRRSGKASVINISSTYAIYGRKGMGAYDATKAGVLAFTRTLAFEEGCHGVRVKAICPGYTRTPFHIKRLGITAVNELVPPCVLQRWAEPSEMAYPVLWLASDEASYITGTTLMVDGGLPF